MIAVDVMAEHAKARPLSAADLKAFVDDGVPPAALSRTACDRMAMVARDRVVFDGSRFDFARDRPEREAVNAFMVPVFGEGGEPADILAWRPDGAAALWLGRLPIVGAEQLFAPRVDLGDELEVHADVMAWLCAGRRGIVILDHRRAADVLDGLTLRTASAEHARLLRAALTRPAPRIVVAPPPSVRQAEERAA